MCDGIPLRARLEFTPGEVGDGPGDPAHIDAILAGGVLQPHAQPAHVAEGRCQLGAGVVNEGELRSLTVPRPFGPDLDIVGSPVDDGTSRRVVQDSDRLDAHGEGGGRPVANIPPVVAIETDRERHGGALRRALGMTLTVNGDLHVVLPGEVDHEATLSGLAPQDQGRNATALADIGRTGYTGELGREVRMPVRRFDNFTACDSHSLFSGCAWG
ncbi:hypothetical protein SAMN05216219_0834 [Mycetocola miduiensis]|uniref:Uncharacterized protein n=1 Tax=Mycetocola miduiensis TaxID=995034 RepID=A0A1I4ZIR2_9MICO|nr:hypothetical protein SAMN05216219_0834 [Mycetocola miduiensis]